jgi:hypothetical protein
MEVNGIVLAAFSIFLLILFTVNLLSNYEQAAKRFDHRSVSLPHKEQILTHIHNGINDRIYHLNEVFSNLNKSVQLDNKVINMTFPDESRIKKKTIKEKFSTIIIFFFFFLVFFYINNNFFFFSGCIMAKKKVWSDCLDNPTCNGSQFPSRSNS